MVIQKQLDALARRLDELVEGNRLIRSERDALCEQSRRDRAKVEKLERMKARLVPGGALYYALERQAGLKLFLGDGRILTDSNLVENAIRPCALGRRSWLFIGHPEAGERSAIFCSLMASCRLHGINPSQYLRDLLGRLPGAKVTAVHKFTRAEWAKAMRSRR